MKLYFHPFSGNSRRVLLVAAHLDAPVEKVVVDLTKGEQRGPANLARNPNGKVPTLEDGEMQLWESRAIMQYLCDVTPGQTLSPTAPKERAEVNRWLSWDNGHFAQALTIIVLENFVKPRTGRETDPAEVKKGEELFHTYAKVLDGHLADTSWVANDQLSIADFSLAAGLQLAGPARIPVEPYPNLRAWLERVQALDSWKRTSAPA
ncbi:MAG TPA: glutathione S-transferase family protein [Kofleriaceae bacterium]|jgi:glutathione S-transferase